MSRDNQGAPFGTGSRPSDQATPCLGAPRVDPSRELWSEDLTDKQLLMIIDSGEDCDGTGFGVELRGSAWATARSLVAKGLGWIEGGRPNGSELPGLFFSNAEGVRILHEFDEPDEDEWKSL